MIGAFVNVVTQCWSGNAQTPGQIMGSFAIGGLAGAAGGAMGLGVGSVVMGGSFWSGVAGTCIVDGVGFSIGAAMGAASGLTGGFITGMGNGLIQGNSFVKSLGMGFKNGVISGASGFVLSGLGAGIRASLTGKHFITGKEPYIYGEVKGYELIEQMYDKNGLKIIGDDNCKNALLESIEKLNGGNRDQIYFKLSGNKNLKIDKYIEQFGFNIDNVDEMTLSQIAKELNKGNPIVLQETISKDRYHILSMTKIRQWTPNSDVRVWLADPARGYWRSEWNELFRFSGISASFLIKLH